MKNIDKKQIEEVIQYHKFQQQTGRLGVITSYDPFNNTATVLISGEQSDVIEDVLSNVLCPLNLGVQSVAPSPGTQCWVVFKNNNRSQALITHYYNYRYSQGDYDKQSKAQIGLPTYLLGM